MREKLTITFLGTGTSHGIPVIACTCEVCTSKDPRDKRLRSSLGIEVAGKNIVIDAGPDFRQQVLREKVLHLDALLLTHEHNDHVTGLDDLRAFNYKQQHAIPVYASNRVQERIKQMFSYIFAKDKYPGIADIHLYEVTQDQFEVSGIPILPIEVMHHKLPVTGFRIGDFCYITDASSISDESMDKIMGSRVFVLNALRQTTHISHFNLQQAVEVIEKLKPEKAYLIHMSHQMGRHSEVEKKLPDYIRLAYDGLKIKV